MKVYLVVYKYFPNPFYKDITIEIISEQGVCTDRKPKVFTTNEEAQRWLRECDTRDGWSIVEADVCGETKQPTKPNYEEALKNSIRDFEKWRLDAKHRRDVVREMCYENVIFWLNCKLNLN